MTKDKTAIVKTKITHLNRLKKDVFSSTSALTKVWFTKEDTVPFNFA
jgi:hypothetical protein